MSFEIATTHTFLKGLKSLAKKHSSVKQDVKELGELLKSDPTQGTPLGKDCYKIRMAISSKGKGKTGGARVIACVKVVRETVYLLSIFDKSEKSSLDDSELDFLLAEAGL